MSPAPLIFWLPGSSTNPNLPKLEPIGWTDSFDRPNGPLATTDNGVPWITQGTWSVVDGTARCTAGTGSLWAVAEANASDGFIEVTADGVEDYAGIAFRHVDDANRLFVNWFNGNIRLYKRVSGTSTLVISITGEAPVAGDVIRVEFHDDTVVVKKNGVILTSQTVAENQSGTKHGLLAGAAGGAGAFASAYAKAA